LLATLIANDFILSLEMIGYNLLVQLTSFDLLLACCAWDNFMLFAFRRAFPFDDAETLSRFEEGAVGAIIPLTFIRLIGSVLGLHPFISAGSTCNVLLVIEKIVNLPRSVFVMHLRKGFSTTSAFVASTLLASGLALLIYHVKVGHGQRLFASSAYNRVGSVVRLMRSVLRLHPFISAGSTRNVLLLMKKIVNFLLSVFVMLLRELFSATSTFVPSTVLACSLALLIHHVKDRH